MQTIHLEKLDDFLQKAKNVSFPEYNGKKYKIDVMTSPKFRMRNYWDGGSRSYYKLINFENNEVISPADSTSNPFNQVAHAELELPANCILIEHSIFCGKDTGLTFHVRAENMNRIALPEKVGLTRIQALVLIYTKSLKPSYAGISNYRFHSAKEDCQKQNMVLSEEDWNKAKQECVSSNYLNKSGAITIKGRNAANSFGFIQAGFGAWEKICNIIKE